MSAMQPVGIILAAGKGTRMKSDLPKALHHIAGIPMVEHVARAMRAANVARIVIVVGHGGELVQKALGDRYEYAWQHQQLGTGHATLMAREFYKDHRGPVVVAPGDVPLLDGASFERLLGAHPGFACTLASSFVSDPTGYGRVVRDADGQPCRIVEEKDAKPDQKAIKEVNAALYCFDAEELLHFLPSLKNSNAQGEYYLTDLVESIYRQGKRVNAVVFDDADVLAGVNDRWQLAQAEDRMRRKIIKRHALAGVTFKDVGTSFVGPDVTIGVDTIVEAGTQIVGSSNIGSRCRLGPFSRFDNCHIGDDSTLIFCQARDVQVESGVICGPYANLRPGTVLKSGVRIGGFVEIKNSLLDVEVTAAHLSYIGDAEVGARTNIGGGTITCNYNGFEKNRTLIGEEVFIGSNSSLVAPVSIGDSALVAAGSTITSDVPENAAAFGRARQETKPGWATKWREKFSSRK